MVSEMGAKSSTGDLAKVLWLLLGVLLFIGLVGGGLWTWHVNRQRLADRFDDEWLPLETARARIIDADDALRRSISPLELETFLRIHEIRQPTLADLAARTSGGDGRSAKQFRQLGEYSAAATQALLNLAEIRKNYEARLAVAEASVEKARDILRTESDPSDFEQAMRDLDAQYNALGEALPEHATGTPMTPAIGLVAEFQQAVQNGLANQVEAERNRVGKAHVALDDALQKLVATRQKMADTIGANTALLENISTISSQLEPAVDMAFSATAPLRNLLSQADAPLGGQVGDVLGNAWNMATAGRPSAGPVSALSLAREIDPSIALTIDLLQGICSGIESARREIGAIRQVTDPLVEAMNRFQAEPNGPATLEMAAAAGRAVGYYRQKIGIFDPILSKINEARPYIGSLYDLGNRIPLARGFFQDCGQAASQLVDAAETPFREGKAAIANLAGELDGVASLQKGYEDELNRLAAGLEFVPDTVAIRLERLDADLPGTWLKRADDQWQGWRFFRARARYRRITESFPSHPAALEARKKIKTAGWIAAGIWGSLFLLLAIAGVVGLVATGSIRTRSRQADAPLEKKGPAAQDSVVFTDSAMPGKTIVSEEGKDNSDKIRMPGQTSADAAPVSVTVSSIQPSLALIEFVRGEFAGTSFPLLAGRTVVIGRDPKEANIVLTDPRISRRHVSICLHPMSGKVVFKDMRSSHGIIINGKKLSAGEELSMAADAAPLVVLADTAAAFILRLGQ